MAKGAPNRGVATRERVLAFVRERLEEGRAPSLREVCAGVGLSALESARAHLAALVAEGRLVKDEGARGWRCPERVAPARFAPLLGRVPAGTLHEAIEERDGEVALDAARHGRARGALFALRVVGMSMKGAAILDGDLVIVDAGAEARSGDVVVARLDGEATVKRLELVGRRVELHPENPDFEPIRVPEGADFALLGRVVEVRRDLDARPPRTPRGARRG